MLFSPMQDMRKGKFNEGEVSATILVSRQLGLIEMELQIFIIFYYFLGQ